MKPLHLKSLDGSTSRALGAAIFVAFWALGCAAASDFDEGNDIGGEPTGEASDALRRWGRAGQIPTASPTSTAAPSSSSVSGVYQWGAVTMDENGVITLMPGAFAPNDDGTDAVGGPSPNVGTPGTLAPQDGGTCPGNAPTAGACAHYGDQCVYDTANRSGYCTCIASTPSAPGVLGWYCY